MLRPTPVDTIHQLGLATRGHHDLPVHARGQTASVSFRDPPHARKRVGEATEHQLLQVADPRGVPSLRRREDPLSQPPYAVLDRCPIHGIPVENLVFRSVHRPAQCCRSGAAERGGV